MFQPLSVFGRRLEGRAYTAEDSRRIDRLPLRDVPDVSMYLREEESTDGVGDDGGMLCRRRGGCIAKAGCVVLDWCWLDAVFSTYSATSFGPFPGWMGSLSAPVRALAMGFIPSPWFVSSPMVSSIVDRMDGREPWDLRRHPFFFFRFGWWWMCGPQRRGWKRPYLLGRSSPWPVTGVHQVVVDVSSPSIPPTVVLVSMGGKVLFLSFSKGRNPPFVLGSHPTPPLSPTYVGGGRGGAGTATRFLFYPSNGASLSVSLTVSQGREGRSFLWGGPMEHLRCVLFLSSRRPPFIRAGCVPPIPLLPSTHTRAHPRPTNMAANMTVEK